MATESPLIHDGAQCTAAVNMSATAGLAGPNGTGQFLAVKLTAARQVSPCSTTQTDIAYGILQNDPVAGFVADVGIFGLSKAVAGAVAGILPGSKLMLDGATAGRLILATAGNQTFAEAVEVPTAPNQVFLVKLFPSYKFA